jgi:hypothetical protein
MIMSFRIIGLPAERFTHLFALSDAELAARGAGPRMRAIPAIPAASASRTPGRAMS